MDLKAVDYLSEDQHISVNEFIEFAEEENIVPKEDVAVMILFVCLITE